MSDGRIEKVLVISRDDRLRQVYTEVEGDVAIARVARAEYMHDPPRYPSGEFIPWDGLTEFQREQYRTRAILTLRSLGDPIVTPSAHEASAGVAHRSER